MSSSGIIATQTLLLAAIAGNGNGQEVAFENVAFLAGWNGADEQTSYTDESSHAHVASAFVTAAELDSTEKVFGTTSLSLWENTGSRVVFPHHSAFNIGLQPFCFEFFIRFAGDPAAASNLTSFFGHWDTSGGTPFRSWRVRFSNVTVVGMFFSFSTDGSDEITRLAFEPAGGWQMATWHHVCIERDDDLTYRAWVDGVFREKVTGTTDDIVDTTKDFFVGQNFDGTGGFVGHIDEMRLIIGQHVHGTDDDFDVPTEEYPREAGISAAVGTAAGTGSMTGFSSAGVAIGTAAGLGTMSGVAPTYAVATAAGVGAMSAVGQARGAHRYWRVFAETNNGDANFIGVGQLEMYQSVYSGANVLTGGTITASSEASGTFAATKAVNGTYHSVANQRWASASTGGTNEWLKYDFGVGVTKEIVSIGAFGSADGEFDQTWKDIRLEWSDDNSAWTTAWTDTKTFAASMEFKRSSNASEVPTYTGSPYGTHTYWRLYIQSVVGAAVSAAEVELRATTGGGDQATGGTPTVSATTVGTAASIFDNNNATHWALNGGAGSWIKYQFASPVTVGQVAYRIRGDSNPTHAPSALLVQFSDDNTVWATAWQVTGQSSWTNGEEKVFTSPDYV
jgi:Concanavalin A-like lectin/glucanases superfamily/F5/8 type C domain